MRLIRLLKNDIAREAAQWVDEEVISQAQAELICERYDVDYHQVNSQSFAYNLLIVLGYLFIGLAVVTIISANWDDIPRAVRMGSLIVLTLATQAFAVRQYWLGDRTKAIGIFLLANIFYGASIILIAQIYHLGEHMPDGIFWWALGCLPFGLLIKNPWLMLQTLVLALIWFFVESDMGFYPTLFPLFVVGALYVLIKGPQSLPLLLATVSSIGFWFEYTLSEIWRDSLYFEFEAEHVVVSVGLFIMVYAMSHWLNSKESVTAKDYGAVLALWSLRFGLCLLMVMSFKDPWQSLLDANWEHQTSMLLLSATFSAVTLYLACITKKLMPVGLIVPLYLITLLMIGVSPDHSWAIYFQVLYNVVLIAAGIWLIIKGIHSGISHYFFLGVSSILITAFMRYIDLIGGYIGGAILFLVFAILLLGAAKYWKSVQNKEVRA